MKERDMPVGFSMALAKNLDAMKYFLTLTEDEKNEVINRTHSINSKSEMQAFVQNLSQGKFI